MGFFGALRTACSIVMDHSVLGRIGLGCQLDQVNGMATITPRDGLSVRCYHIPQHWCVEVEGGVIEQIDTDGVALTIRARATCAGSMKVCVRTIPNAGEESRMIAQWEDHPMRGNATAVHAVRL